MAIACDAGIQAQFDIARNRLVDCYVAETIIDEVEDWAEEVVVEATPGRQNQFAWAGMPGMEATFAHNTIVWHPATPLRAVEFHETMFFRSDDNQQRRIVYRTEFDIPTYITLIHEMFHALQYKRNKLLFKMLAPKPGNLLDPENLKRCEWPVSKHFGVQARRSYRCTQGGSNEVLAKYRELGWATESRFRFNQLQNANRLTSIIGTMAKSPFNEVSPGVVEMVGAI